MILPFNRYFQASLLVAIFLLILLPVSPAEAAQAADMSPAMLRQYTTTDPFSLILYSSVITKIVLLTNFIAPWAIDRFCVAKCQQESFVGKN